MIVSGRIATVNGIFQVDKLQFMLKKMKEELITMLKAGDKAPEFSLPAQDGKTYSLEDFADHTLIMFFYIKDNTPG